jgi:PKD repeat protein/photosystem II stability/assembly factor-like uncharacterized protein
MAKRYLLIIFVFSVFQAAMAQTPKLSATGKASIPATPMELPLVDTTVRWVSLMQSPNPNYYEVKKAFEAHFGGVIPEKGQGYKVFKRWEARVLDHLDANGNVVWPNGVLAEIQQPSTTGGGPTGGSAIGGLNAGNPVTPATWCATSGRWSLVGPAKHPYNQTSQPTGTGRINGLAFHPKDSNTFFALAPQGGVWKTTDFGKNWIHLWGAGTGLVTGTSAPSNPSLTLGVSSMVLSHKNPDTMYIGTGDRDAGDAPGYGVLMSANGGGTFVVRNSGMGNVTVGKLVMHPKNTAILLAATNGGVYRTVNSGATWTKVSITGNFVDIVYHPTNPNLLYTTQSGLFYRSTDGGVSFTQITNGVPASGMQRGQIAVTAADPSRVYFLIASGSRFQGFYLSIDSGANFANRNSSPANILGYSEIGNDGSGQGWYDLDLAADPFNATTVYAFGINVWKSTDGGATFKISGHWVGSGSADDIHADQHSGEFGASGKTLFAGNDGGVYFTRNGGKTWNNITQGISNSQIYRLAVAQSEDDLGAHGYQDNGSMQHDDGQVFTYFGGDGMDCAVDPSDSRYVYGSYVYGYIYRAIEKNNIITLAANGTNGINEGGGWLTPFVLQEGNPNRMFAGYNNVWRCDSVKSAGAIKWTKISTGWTGSVRQIKSSKANPRHLYVIRGDGKLMFTRNAEAAVPVWVDVTPATALFSLRIMEADPLDSNKLYGASTVNLYQSSNNGVTWNTTVLASLTKTAYAGFNWGVINVLKADHSVSPAGLYVGTDRAVYYMNQVSGTLYGLNEFANQLPLWMDVSDLDIYHSPLGRDFSYIYASTYGRGVWKSPLFDDGSGTYQSKMFSYDSVFAVGGVMQLQERVPASVSGLKGLEWSISPTTYSWVKGGANDMQPEVKFNQSGIYEVSLTAKSCATSASVAKKLWVRVFPPPAAAACVSKTRFQTSNYGIGVFDVKLTDNHFESGTYFDDGEQLDMSLSKVFRLKPSTDYTVQVKVGLYNAENVRVFVDYNNDGKFQDYLGEVSAQTTGTPNNYAQVKIKTPAGLKKNQALRMRVISDYNNIDTSGCGTCNYGQAEDFSLVYEKTTVAFGADQKKICAGDSVVFRDSSQGLIGLYEWDFGAGAMPAKAVGQGPWTVKYTTGGFKNVKLRLNGGEDSLVKMAMIDVVKLPNATVGVKLGANPQCEGQEFALAANDNQKLPIIYNWYKLGAPNVQIVKDSILYFNALMLQDTGNYFAVLENRGCYDTSQLIYVDVWAKPNAIVFTDVNYTPCLRGNAFVFDDGSNIAKGAVSQRNWSTTSPSKTGTGKQFLHTFSAVGTHTVTLEIASNQGCKDTARVQVVVKGHPTAKFTFAKSEQCDNKNVFQVVNASTNPIASGGGAVWCQYNWGDGNTVWDAMDATHSYLKYGKYPVQLIVKNASGCTDTASQQAIVYLTPTAGFALSKTEVCEGEVLTINDLYVDHADPNDRVVCAWDFGDGRKWNQQFIKKGSNRDSIWSYVKFGNYTIKRVLKTAKLGCKDSAMGVVVVNSIPNAKVTVSPLKVCATMQTVQFANQSVGADGKPLTYDWTMGDGEGNSTQTSPSYLFGLPGKYTARCIANNRGCLDTAFAPQIEVVPAVSGAFGYSEFVKNQRLGWHFGAKDTLLMPLDRQFDWRFEHVGGEISIAPGAVVDRYFEYNGSYKAKLVVTNSLGCRDSSEQQFDVNSAILKNQSNDLNAYVFPNPTSNKTTYKFSARKGDVVTVKMVTVIGQQGLYERTWNIAEDGVYFDEISMKRWNLSNGVYPLLIQRGDQRVEVKMILMD